VHTCTDTGEPGQVHGPQNEPGFDDVHESSLLVAKMRGWLPRWRDELAMRGWLPLGDRSAKQGVRSNVDLDVVVVGDVDFDGDGNLDVAETVEQEQEQDRTPTGPCRLPPRRPSPSRFTATSPTTSTPSLV